MKVSDNDLNILDKTTFYLSMYKDRVYVVSETKINERFVSKRCLNTYGDFIVGITNKYLDNKLVKRTQGNLIFNLDSNNNIISWSRKIKLKGLVNYHKETEDYVSKSNFGTLGVETLKIDGISRVIVQVFILKII